VTGEIVGVNMPSGWLAGELCAATENPVPLTAISNKSAAM
jgi:hypothetical protein